MLCVDGAQIELRESCSMRAAPNKHGTCMTHRPANERMSCTDLVQYSSILSAEGVARAFQIARRIRTFNVLPL